MIKELQEKVVKCISSDGKVQEGIVIEVDYKKGITIAYKHNLDKNFICLNKSEWPAYKARTSYRSCYFSILYAIKRNFVDATKMRKKCKLSTTGQQASCAFKSSNE